MQNGVNTFHNTIKNDNWTISMTFKRHTVQYGLTLNSVASTLKQLCA